MDIGAVIQAEVNKAKGEDTNDADAGPGEASTLAEDVVAEDSTSEEDAPGGTDDPIVEELPAAIETPVVRDPVVEKPVDDTFAKEHGIRAKDKHGRENKIPYSAVVRINGNAVKKARTAWEAEQAPVTSKVKDYEDRLARIGETERIMFDEPERFLQMLSTSVKGYAKLLAQTGAAPAPVVRDVDPLGEEPSPDVDMGGGQFGYSREGLAKLRAWDRDKAAAAAEDRLSKRFKPIEDAYSQSQRSGEMNRGINMQLDEGMKWPGFSDNAPAILKALEDDFATNPRSPRFRTLRDAYDAVVLPKFQVDRTAIETELRAKILDELRKAPRSTSAGHTAAPAAAGRNTDSTGDPVRDAIFASIKGLK